MNKSRYYSFVAKKRIIDVKKETKDGVIPVSRDVHPYKRWQFFIYNLFSVKTKDGWFLLNCPDKFFNRPPQIGMFIRANKKLKQWEICGRSGR